VTHYSAASRYSGSKRFMAASPVSLRQNRSHYMQPYSGCGTVFLSKEWPSLPRRHCLLKPALTRTYLPVNSSRVLPDRTDDLGWALKKPPRTRHEHAVSVVESALSCQDASHRDPSPDDACERSRQEDRPDEPRTEGACVGHLYRLADNKVVRPVGPLVCIT
jgi:hypothetical protein